MADLPLISTFYPKKVEFQKKVQKKYKIDINQDHAKIYSIHSLLSNIIFEPIHNNIDRIFNDSTRINTSFSNLLLSIKCFNRLNTLRKENVNYQELLGILFCPLINYLLENNTDKINQTMLNKLINFVVYFDMKMPVFKKYFCLQGIGSSFTIYKNNSVDSSSYLLNDLIQNDSLSEQYLMTIFYFVTLFAQQFTDFEDQIILDFILELFITKKTSQFKLFRYVLYFFSENLFISSSSSIILSSCFEKKKNILKNWKFPRRINRNKLILFNKSNDIKNVRM